jgi:hypothetical protein
MNKTLEYVTKKYNITLDKRYQIEIPNMGRDDMAALFAELGFKLGVEVGVAVGDYSKVLCEKNPRLHLYGVDPWLLTAYEPEINPAEAGNVDSQPAFDNLYERAKRTVALYNVTLLKKTSAEALNDFTDNSLDFVYIDANHDFPNFIFDLHYWMKKVRPGGIISGHDYAIFSYRKHNHVKRALDAYATSYRMIPLFIIGAEEYKEGTTRDRFRSWMYIKP